MIRRVNIQKFTSLILATCMLLSCAPAAKIFREDSGTFRGMWYNYYERGLDSSEKDQWDQAVNNLQESIAQKEKDQMMVRTYGLHFIDYFPHRELGIVYFSMGKIDESIRELQASISHERSAKAVYYLNWARKKSLTQKNLYAASPAIEIHSPLNGKSINGFEVNVSGRVTAEGYVSTIRLNGTAFRFDLARKELEFEKTITVEEGTHNIVVEVEDLLGNRTKEDISLMVDRDGPTINIIDIITENNNGIEAFRITGEAYDRTGIRNLLLGNKIIKADNSTEHTFNVLIDKKFASTVFSIKASDILDNVTTAEIDLESELTASSKNEPVLLAFKGKESGSFTTDSKPPTITLKEMVDLPEVFIDRYYVEGEASDNTKVESIQVNGTPILTRQGKKVFFSKVVKLDEGKNTIDVEAYDSSGNRSQANFSVTRNIPDALKVGSRMRISILPFDTKSVKSAFTRLANEQLMGSFIDQKRFKVIERIKLEQVLLEQKLTSEKLTDPRFSIKVGRLMAADAILATSVNEDKKSIEFISRVINTKTSEVMAVMDVYTEDKNAASIKQLMQGLASKVAAAFPLVKGVVTDKDRNYIYSDLGSAKGIKKDIGVIVYRKGKEMKHPVTGKSLGWKTEKLGQGNIEEVDRDFSKAALSDRHKIGDIHVMDMVITK